MVTMVSFKSLQTSNIFLMSDHPIYTPPQTAGAPVEAQPRYGSAYFGDQRPSVEGQTAIQNKARPFGDASFI